MFTLELEQHQLNLQIQTGDELQDILFDADKLQKIIENLLSNAIKFTPEHGTITVRANKNDDELIIVVADTGTGIPGEMVDKIFDRFIQVNPGPGARGTGIGLALVKELTELLGGAISVKSEISKGTVFTVTMPIEAGIAKNAPPLPAFNHHIPILTSIDQPTLPSFESEKQTILIVEDNAELNDFIVSIFMEEYNILTAVNGEIAWEICLTEFPDLVISDVMMPIMDGFELCDKIKRLPETDHIAVILLTAKASWESQMEGLSYRANDYLTKPFQMWELHKRAQNLLNYQLTLSAHYREELKDLSPISSLPKAPNPFLEKLYEKIDHNLDNTNFSTEVLASELAVSSRTLNRKLSTLIGLSANEVIRNFRLKKAAAFISSGSNISEAAYRSGFESPSYFGQCFKELYAVTPTEFQQRGNMPDS